MKHIQFLSVFAFLLFLSLCTKQPKVVEPEQENSAKLCGTVGNPSCVSGQKTPVSAINNIVFIDKKDACQCTRTRCDHGWSALQEELKKIENPPPVERVYFDEDEIKIENLRKQKPFATLPVIYFCHEQGEVLSMIQGEITAEQISQLMY